MLCELTSVVRCYCLQCFPLIWQQQPPDFINASPKLEFAVRKAKKWLYSEVFLCQEESFCEGGIIFG